MKPVRDEVVSEVKRQVDWRALGQVSDRVSWQVKGQIKGQVWGQIKEIIDEAD